MTNAEKYNTAQDRAEAFSRFCNSFDDHCHGCPVADDCSMKDDIAGSFAWLDLEAEEEKPLPCPFCGGEMDVSASKCAIHCVCGYSSPIDRNISKVIAAHNRVAKNCQEAK